MDILKINKKIETHQYLQQNNSKTNRSNYQTKYSVK